MYTEKQIQVIFNLEVFNEYEDVEVEIVTTKETKRLKVEKLYVDMIEGECFIIKVAEDEYDYGFKWDDELLYVIEDDEKILMNKG